jgi:hypothetical protein
MVIYPDMTPFVHIFETLKTTLITSKFHDAESIVKLLNEEMDEFDIKFAIDNTIKGNAIEGKYNPFNNVIKLNTHTTTYEALMDYDTNQAVVKCIIGVIGHEMIHAVQFHRANNKVNPLLSYHKKSDVVKEYLAKNHEIMPYAYQVVQDIRNELDIDESLIYLRKFTIYSENVNDIPQELALYKYVFGYNRDKNDRKVYNKFLKNVYRYIEVS